MTAILTANMLSVTLVQPYSSHDPNIPLLYSNGRLIKHPDLEPFVTQVVLKFDAYQQTETQRDKSRLFKTA